MLNVRFCFVSLNLACDVLTYTFKSAENSGECVRGHHYVVFCVLKLYYYRMFLHTYNQYNHLKDLTVLPKEILTCSITGINQVWAYLHYITVINHFAAFYFMPCNY